MSDLNHSIVIGVTSFLHERVPREVDQWHHANLIWTHFVIISSSFSTSIESSWMRYCWAHSSAKSSSWNSNSFSDDSVRNSTNVWEWGGFLAQASFGWCDFVPWKTCLFHFIDRLLSLSRRHTSNTRMETRERITLMTNLITSIFSISDAPHHLLVDETRRDRIFSAILNVSFRVIPWTYATKYKDPSPWY